MARLLTPADFGVFAAAFTVIDFSEIFGLLGVGPAIVQREQLEEKHVYTGFASSMLFGLFLTALLWFLAPGIASFYQSDKLTSVLRVVVLVFPLNSLAVVGESLMQRQLHFRKLIGIEVVAIAIGSGLVGIGTGLIGWGVWALVAASLTKATLRTGAILVMQPHSKKLRFDVQAFKELFSFGGGLTIGRILNYFALQGDYLVVGRWLGMDALGLYTRAYHLMGMISNLLGQALEKVLFPSMAKVQNEPERLAKAYKRGVAVIGLILLPISVSVWTLAPEVITVLLGPGWSGAIVPFRILTVGVMFRASYKISVALVGAKGAVYRNAWRQGVYATLVVAGAWIGQHWGISGVALGVFVALIVHFLVMAQLAMTLLPLTWRQFWAVHLPAVWLAVIVGVEVWGVATFLRDLNVASIFILVANALVVPLSILLLIRFVPTYFWGSDGQWFLRLLLERLPDNIFFRPWRKRKVARSPGSTD